ncbi:MAG: hypothetical protein SF029_04140 [bacterium]|nr:hypothetical protein [bacterium]
MIEVVAAFFLYAVVHSLLAGKRAKQTVRKWLGERAYHGLYRIGYNIFAVLTVLHLIPGDGRATPKFTHNLHMGMTKPGFKH